MADKNNVKKVKAYPFPVNFQIGTLAVPGQIVKLTLQGFLAEVGLGSLKPGDRFECSFELPVLHHFISSPGVMMKLYNQWSGSSEAAVGVSNEPKPPAPGEGSTSGPNVLHLIEFHFQNLSAENRGKIQAFLSALSGKG